MFTKVPRSIILLVCAALAAALLLTPREAGAEDFPSKPVRIIVPTAAGSLPDMAVRRIAERLARRWNQQVLVDNRPGAATSLGARAAADAAPDGYTLFYAPFNTLVVNPVLYKSLPYDPVRDFAPVTLIGKASFVLVVNGSIPARSFSELVAYARSSGKALRYGSGGPGTPQHIFGELLRHSAKLEMTHVPYKSAPPALADLVGGHIDLMFEAVATTLPYFPAQRLHPLAVTGQQRIKELPDVPTMSELGLSSEEWTLWGGFVVPAKTPIARIALLNTALREENAALALADDLPGTVRIGNTPEEFQRYIESEAVKWRRLIGISGARVE